MEVESFENEEVAKLQNDWFVNIKVTSFTSHNVLVFVTNLRLFTVWRASSAWSWKMELLYEVNCCEVDLT